MFARKNGNASTNPCGKEFLLKELPVPFLLDVAMLSELGKLPGYEEVQSYLLGAWAEVDMRTGSVEDMAFSKLQECLVELRQKQGEIEPAPRPWEQFEPYRPLKACVVIPLDEIAAIRREAFSTLLTKMGYPQKAYEKTSKPPYEAVPRQSSANPDKPGFQLCLQGQDQGQGET